MKTYLPALLLALLTVRTILSAGLDTTVATLDYGPSVIRATARELASWRTADGTDLLAGWRKRLETIRRKARPENPAVLEASIINGLYARLNLEFTGGGPWELPDMLAARKANCVGYSQLLYAIGTWLGFTVTPAQVLRFADDSAITDGGHVCVLFTLSDSSRMTVDPARNLISPPFRLDDVYRTAGGHLVYEARDSLKLHQRIQLGTVKNLIADRWYNTGLDRLHRDRPDSALGYFARALRYDPHKADAYNNLGRIYQRKAAHDTALAMYRRAVRADSSHVGAHNNTGVLFLELAMGDSALRYFKKTVLLDTARAVAWYNIGHIRSMRGQNRSALRHFRQAVRHDAFMTEAYNNMGLIYFNAGVLDSARVMFKKTIETRRDHVQAHINLGITCADLGRIDEAKQYLVKAAIIDSTVETAVRELAGKYKLDIFRE